MVDGAVADASFLHMADNCLECFDVFAWIAVHLDVGNVTSVTKCMIWCFDVDFLEGRDWIVDRNVEGVSVEVAISDTFNLAKFLAIHLGKATRETFGWSCEKREVEVIFLGCLIAEVAHVFFF